MRQPSFVEGLGALLAEERARGLEGLAALAASSAAPPRTCPTTFVEDELRLLRHARSPARRQLRERWKRGVSLVEGALGEAVGRVYVERHFPPGAKAAMDELVANLIEAYRAEHHRRSSG